MKEMLRGGEELMKKTLAIVSSSAVLFAASLLPVFAGSPAVHYGPFTSTSPDSSTCGNDWATDTFERHFTVNQNKPNVVVEQFKNGTFVTSTGHSPGACETGPDNGNTVGDGITGKMHGEFTIVVTGGTFNPNAVCTDATCGTTAGFVSSVYGPGATYDVPTFEFHYSAGNNGEWKNASSDRGGNQGDITGTL